MKLNLEIIKLDGLRAKCKGLFFRCRTSRYFLPEKNQFGEKTSFTLLKKMSCPGCQYCGWLFGGDPWADLEYGCVWPDEVENGVIYIPKIIHSSEDDLEWKLVKWTGGDADG